MLRHQIDRYRDRVVARTTDLFSHAEDPLEHTLTYPGDPGLFGPDSVTWRVMGDVASFIGGIRALVIQAAHPEVAAGVADHSAYRTDPLGRLSRTSAYVTATSFGAIPEVEAAVALVRRAHAPVRGRSERGRHYSASAPDLAAWVHNALTESFLVAYQHFGPQPLSTDEADRFVAEQTKVGALLRARPLPETAAELREFLVAHADIEESSSMRQAAAFLSSPPLPLVVRPAYRVLFAAAAATIPNEIRRIVGSRRRPGAVAAGRRAVDALRWSLGSSPAWHLALVRVGAPVPAGLFRQPLPVSAPRRLTTAVAS